MPERHFKRHRQGAATECELSVVVPVFNEKDNLQELCTELLTQLSELTDDWQIILVDDGSVDGSWQVIEKLHQQNNKIAGLRLAGNFGHQFALLAGLHHAAGKAVVTMDGDLQHPPAVINQMVALWKQGFAVVQARRAVDSSTTFLKKITSKWFYSIFSLLSGVPLVAGLSDFRLLDRKALRFILQFGESGLFWRGIVQLTGFKSTIVDYEVQTRRHGRTKYSFLKMCNLAWTGITSFSLIPLRLAVVVGGLVSLMAFSELLYVFYVRLFTTAAVPGWASALSLISFLFGVLFILLGIVGEYVGRILVEVRRRPRYILADSLGVEQVADREAVGG